MNPPKPLINVNVHANRVPRILPTGHKVEGLLRGREVIHLQLELIAVRVRVLHAGADAVVDGPVRENAAHFLLLVSSGQVRQAVDRKGNMIDGCRRLPVLDRSVAGVVDDHETVVLIAVGDKDRFFVAEDNAANEEVQVPLHHLLEILGGRANAKVAHAGGAGQLGLGGGHGGCGQPQLKMVQRMLLSKRCSVALWPEGSGTRGYKADLQSQQLRAHWLPLRKQAALNT